MKKVYIVETKDKDLNYWHGLIDNRYYDIFDALYRISKENYIDFKNHISGDYSYRIIENEV